MLFAVQLSYLIPRLFQIPLVIKLHWTRQAFNSRSQKSYDEYKAGCRCQFILRRCGERPTAGNGGAHFGGDPASAASQKTPRLKKVGGMRIVKTICACRK